MAPPTKQENVIRRLFRESEARWMDTAPGSPPEFGADIADVAEIVKRLDHAAAEMERLRALVASQQSMIYEQRRDLARARRDLADALAHGVRSEQAHLSEKDRADQAVVRLDRITAEMTILQSHFGKVTAAVSRTLNPDVRPLRVVA